ncbi:MAG TPA: SurA N-terminal domain-containing protein [Planctomycetota bacterium]|nr:SurA N-terminal domain-containing protein [Planctomycetota bacterium]
MAVRILPLLLLLAGCSSTPPAQESPMAPAEGPARLLEERKPPERTQELHGIAARINNEIVTWKDVRDAIGDVKEVTPELRRARLRTIAQERLFLQAARQNGVTVSEQELDDHLRRETRTYGGEEEYEKLIRLSGKTKTEWREDKRRQILVHKLYRHLIQKAWQAPDAKTPGLLLDFVAPEEIDEFYRQNSERFQSVENVTFVRIALQFSSPAEESAKRAIAESVLRRLAEGAEFHMLAFFYSDVRRAREFDDRSKTRAELEQFFEKPTVDLLLGSLKVGEISPIVKDRNTLNIFRVEHRQQQRAETRQEAEPKIRNYLENIKREENRRKLLAHLIKDAYLWPRDLFNDP